MFTFVIIIEHTCEGPTRRFVRFGLSFKKKKKKMGLRVHRPQSLMVSPLKFTPPIPNN